MSVSKLVIVTLSLIVIISGCTTPPIKTHAPEGFAGYRDTQDFKAISSDSVVYQIRELENKPSADLNFWKKALKKHMIDSGYHFVSEADLKGEAGLGYLIELAAPVRNEDYTYLIALYVEKKRLLVAESAGEVSKIKQHREAIITAMKSIPF